MTVRKLGAGMAALLAASALAGSASAVAFQNGSFELATVTPGAFTTLGAGSTAITGWLVGGGGIDYIGSYWQHQDGNRSIDLSALSAGSISQTFDTVIGQSYLVSFWLAGNPAGSPTVKTISTLASGDTIQQNTFSTAGQSLGNMGWVRQSYQFTAAATSTTLTFASETNTSFGPALDNVSLSLAVPEPATWALMIGGFGLAGAMLRRRAVQVAA